MRSLSPEFMACLTQGFLADLRAAVAGDADLNLDIRANYLNVYYKGNSLLKLTERTPARYQISIHPKFVAGLRLPTHLVDVQTTTQFVDAIPHIKHNIAHHGKRSIELEYEQMIIRANNQESRNNSDYFIVDRQYTMKAGRFDLLGIFWDRVGRRRNQEVPLCLFENKFGLNQDIASIHDQILGYYNALAPRVGVIAAEVQGIFRQKLELGLYRHSAQRVAAMKTLRVSPDISQAQFIVTLVDYNPYSVSFDVERLKALPFAPQVRVFRSGFGMWQQNVLPIMAEPIA